MKIEIATKTRWGRTGIYLFVSTNGGFLWTLHYTPYEENEIE